ncbi:MAG: hypothetical protein J6P61_02425, partial [Erysipelotrichaceae bacterium]|nr:hypothetical protein [Erysipelotrichaceae bacterium]
MEKKRKLRLKKSVKITLITILGVFIAVLLGILVYKTFLSSPVRKKVEIEAGETIDMTLFVKESLFRKSEDYTFSEDVSDYTHSVGEHDITILKGEHEYHSQLSVIDTTPPVAEAKTAKGYTHHKIKPKKLVQNVQDATSLTYAFKEEPDYELEGKQNVVVVITDEGGNAIEVESKLNLDVDVTDPVIKGARNLVVVKDTKVDYKKGVTVTDNIDKDLKLTIDDSKVRLDTVGAYKLTYSTTDLSGNSASKTVTVTVVLKDLKDSTTEDVNVEIDPILKKIYKQSDSQRKKALAIYNYVKSNVGYENNKIKGPWQYGAMYALKNG